MTRLRRQDGHTLVELLVAMTLSLLILGATLVTFMTMERNSQRNQRQNEAQDLTRFAVDSLARRLRNLASPSDASGATAQQPIERATAQDLIFRTVNSAGPASADSNPQNLERYRYCLDTATSRLYVERQTWGTGGDPGMPTTTACPGSGWPEVTVAAQWVTNGARPIFTYELNPIGSFNNLTSVPSDSFSSVVGLRAELFVDRDTAHAPGETTLTTRVFLRNQNRPPTASMEAPVPTGGRKLQLNGTGSDDPEGAQLTYAWYVDDQPLTTTSATPMYTAPEGTHTIYLVVTDAGGLSAQSPTYTFNCDQTSCSVLP